MSNLLIPQAFLQYKLMQSSGPPQAGKGIFTPSSFGAKPLQSELPMAKLTGDYRPLGAMSKVMLPKSHGKSYRLERDFLNIENHKLSLLTPEVRLYRVVDGVYKPFYFPVSSEYNFTDSGTFDHTKPFTSNSAVLKSFNVDYLGDDLYAAGLGMLEASLSVELDSISTLFERPSESFAELADLILIRVPESERMPNSGGTPENGALESGKSIQIAATMGYSIVDKDGIFTSAEIAAIKDTRVLIHLFYKGRTISYQQNGSITINAQYHGNLQAVGQDYIYNVVEKYETKQRILDIKKSQQAESTPSSGKDAAPKDIRKPKEDKKKKHSTRPKERRPNYLTSIVAEIGKVIDNLHLKEKIYPVVFDSKSKGFFKFQEATPSEPGSAPVTAATAGKSQDDILAQDYVFYVNFGDIIDAFIAKITEMDFTQMQRAINHDEEKNLITKEKANKMRKEIQASKKFLQDTNIFFGDVTLRAKGSEKEKVINIADVPVSLDIIYTAIYEDYIKPRKYFLGLRELITKFCTSIINDALMEYSGADLIKKARVTVNSVPGINLRSKISAGKGIVDVKHLNTQTADLVKSKKQKSANYIIFHPVRVASSRSPGKAQVIQDHNDGIIHLRPSQDRGLIKNISFAQQSQFGLEEYLIVGHGDAFDALRIPHNATVTMYGNTLFTPSMEVYVDPEPFGFGDPRGLNAASRRLGIGGYYTILKVSTSFTGGTLTTTLQLQFANYPETRGEPRRSPGAEQARRDAEDLRKRAAAITTGGK